MWCRRKTALPYHRGPSARTAEFRAKELGGGHRAERLYSRLSLISLAAFRQWVPVYRLG